MARRKKSIPQSIQKMQKRIDGMKSIDPALDFGEGVSVVTMETAVKKVVDEIGDFNTTLSSLDDKDNKINADIKAATDLSNRALNAAKFKFGANSSEYEMMGGTRTSERKKATKKDEPTV